MVTEWSAKLCAVVIPQWLLHHGCWDDPHQSLFKAAQMVNRLMGALVEGAVESPLTSILQLLRHSGSCLSLCKAPPRTDQRLVEGLDWPTNVSTSCV